MLAHAVLRRATWLLEVPGFQGGGPDVLNVRLLKAIRDGAPLPRIPRVPEGRDRKAIKEAAAKASVGERAKKTVARTMGARKAAKKARKGRS